MGMKRKIKRIVEETKATFRIAKKTSFHDWFTTFKGKFIIQKLVKNGYKESEHDKKILLKKHKIMLEYFERTFGDFLVNYTYDTTNDIIIPESHNIWVCWWQGIENAPEIVKKCISSIKKWAGNHQVIIITEDNYKNYIDVPQIIENKFNDGIISRTNLSDFLRFSLLARYGGMWLDSTFFVNGDLDQYFKKEVWPIKRPDYLHCSVAGGLFAGYSLQCHSSARWIFKAARDFFIYYWSNNNFLIDYLLVDYMLMLVINHNEKAKKFFDSIVPNNPNCDELLPFINDAFSISIWNDLKKNTDLYKLSWKTTISFEVDSFANHIFSNEN